MASPLIPTWRAARGHQSWTQPRSVQPAGGVLSPRDDWGKTPKGHRGPSYSEVNTGKVASAQAQAPSQMLRR